MKQLLWSKEHIDTENLEEWYKQYIDSEYESFVDFLEAIHPEFDIERVYVTEIYV